MTDAEIASIIIIISSAAIPIILTILAIIYIPKLNQPKEV